MFARQKLLVLSTATISPPHMNPPIVEKLHKYETRDLKNSGITFYVCKPKMLLWRRLRRYNTSLIPYSITNFMIYHIIGIFADDNVSATSTSDQYCQSSIITPEDDDNDFQLRYQTPHITLVVYIISWRNIR